MLLALIWTTNRYYIAFLKGLLTLALQGWRLEPCKHHPKTKDSIGSTKGSEESFTPLLLLHQWTAIIIILLLLFSHISVCANQSDRYYIYLDNILLFIASHKDYYYCQRIVGDFKHESKTLQRFCHPWWLSSLVPWECISASSPKHLFFQHWKLIR